jgi:imidazolonepropionase-like amidohydrolase
VLWSPKSCFVDTSSDYGFAWTPHGTYARDLSHFQKLLGFTAHESIIAATYGVAKLMMRDNEMGQVKVGNYADCILIDGKPLDDIEVLQDHSKLNVIVINGKIHKAGQKEYQAQPVAGSNGDSSAIVPALADLSVNDQQKNASRDRHDSGTG